MITKIKFNSKICTTKEQSERLIALGLKKETADCTLFRRSKNAEWEISTDSYVDWVKEILPLELGYTHEDIIPAWSLHRLWELLPKSIWHDNGLEKKYHPIIEYGFVNYVAECGMELFDFDCGYDVWRSMIVVIEWLIKEGYFNKEYLEE